MKIVQFMGAAITLTMLGGAVASAHAIASSQMAGPQLPSVTRLAAAMSTPSFTSNMPGAATMRMMSKADLMPKKLPLANFGQWNEAASEN
ncbi:hypothetical protein ACELLULO517_23285 [Acidisoma cellulosilytica]|uniref:Uncharacterized protein n=1 Tax=Acidisoma cellulosilyticum TaxID=2802395 RepID=A0A963Z5I6_9PROT|nr:hypothetical protein [Acidisoma cellulosilyticum]MCB8883192.1 hypothetical protein [Acidisoma cellulosilyticum]